MSGVTVAIDPNDPLLASAFAKEMLKQMKALDTYDMYEKWPAERILAPLVLTKERKAEIPIIGDPDETTMARVKAYYNALSCMIESETGFMAVSMINLSHEGFGRAVITIGKLVVVDKTLRDVHRFGFKTFGDMCAEANKIVAKAVELAQKFPDVVNA